MEIRYAPSGENLVVRGTKDWREMIALDPRPHKVVASSYRVAPNTITAAKKEFGVATKSGPRGPRNSK